MDVAGAFDSAPFPKLVEALLPYDIPGPICKLVGTWLTGRTFKIKLRPAIGAVYSGGLVPSRGAPQGGVLSLLRWLLHFD